MDGGTSAVPGFSHTCYIALDCSLGRLSGAGIFERSLSGSERLSFLFWRTLGKCFVCGRR